MSNPPKNEESHRNLIESFQAYLHTVIAAEQFGKSVRLPRLPGWKIKDYCAALAKLPDNALAGELAKPVRAILKQIDKTVMDFQRPLHQKKVNDPAKQAEYERILWQLDFALALVMHQLPLQAGLRAKTTCCRDLLSDTIYHMAIGNGLEAARLVRRFQKEFPEDYREEDGSVSSDTFPHSFAWDTYQRVEALDSLADEFPDYIRTAARGMHGWPMLVHRHTFNKKRFKELAARLELGAMYPLDASEGARFRPDKLLVKYLGPLVRRMHIMREEIGGLQFNSVEDERALLLDVWWWWPDEEPGEEELAALRAARQLPPLTKATAILWAEKAVVPVIMATNARDWKNCGEPALQRIAEQRGVKSRATFKSRLLSAVSATLRRMARLA